LAKALLGYVGGSDLRLIEETRRLRQRVADLEAQLMRLQAENDSLCAAIHEGQMLMLADTEGQYQDEYQDEYQPALT
jgi:hypothetical protein